MINHGNAMATSSPFPDEFEYPPPGHGVSTSLQGLPSSSVRPTLDAYYHHGQQHHGMPQQQQYSQPTPTHHAQHSLEAVTQHPYYVAPQPAYMQHYASTPAALASSSSLKRKMTAVVANVATASSPPPFAQDKLCDLCQHADPILYAPNCGHLFHSRCVNVWPLHHCPACRMELDKVSVLRIDMNEQVESRSGKWTRAEEKFIEVILQEFDRNSFALANGTPVRLVLAKLLNCSTMRLSKKFQKNALGKRTFRIPKPAKGIPAMEFDREDHVVRQKEFSRLEAIFRHELVEQFRRENNTDEGAYVETQNLRKAVKQFWVANFLKFAVMVGQAVEGLDVSDSKKKKLAFQMLRDGQYDELLSWHLPAHISSGYPGDHGAHPGAHWSNSGAAVSMGYPTVTTPTMQHDGHHPQKKQRTPETMARLQMNTEMPANQFSLPGSSASSYEYGRGPVGYNAPYSSSVGYEQNAYGQYPVMKQDRSPVSYEEMAHASQHHAPVQPHAYGASSHVMPPYDGRGVSESASMVHPVYHSTQTTTSLPMGHGEASYQAVQGPSSGSSAQSWDGLLDEMAPGASAPSSSVSDPTMQAWSNMHIM
ncbi:hypothetical protein Poli38472_002198 [Pythium oligandrum]|uniref:RING-type domain-containing protein n=1 Tax=Pythium oligandrum TaxID=41045 RepID=A0A8K1FKX0_PYTOL|nr:hypothetical protein Poli38472_002198 [Pythium oligandrum]|eukprot:TMW63257.1 hypothetical protein Poli38472_002198 [Pythium oligandrum]